MFFLPEQVAEYDTKRLGARELVQLELFVKDEESAIQWLRQQLTKKPQTFQEIHPHFIRELGGWQKHEKMIELSEFLGQNFLCYDGRGEVPSQIHAYLSGNFKELRNLPKEDFALRAKARDRWYVPDARKAGDLDELRTRGLLREFDEYRHSTQRRLKLFRLEAIRAGFRRAWQARDYATIVEVARKVPENVLQEDSEAADVVRPGAYAQRRGCVTKNEAQAETKWPTHVIRSGAHTPTPERIGPEARRPQGSRRALVVGSASGRAPELW